MKSIKQTYEKRSKRRHNRTRTEQKEEENQYSFQYKSELRYHQLLKRKEKPSTMDYLNQTVVFPTIQNTTQPTNSLLSSPIEKKTQSEPTQYVNKNKPSMVDIMNMNGILTLFTVHLSRWRRKYDDFSACVGGHPRRFVVPTTCVRARRTNETSSAEYEVCHSNNSRKGQRGVSCPSFQEQVHSYSSFSFDCSFDGDYLWRLCCYYESNSFPHLL